MEIIEPKVELIEQGVNPIAHVARCARVCYGKEEGNDEKTYNNLLKAKHLSMFRHESVYAIIPFEEVQNKWYPHMDKYMKCPYIYWESYNNIIYLVTNRNFMIDLKNDIRQSNHSVYNMIENYKVSPQVFKDACKVSKNLMRYTFKITTQISTSRELNRVSPNNISERSTRYVKEDGTICRPHWLTREEADKYQENKLNEIDTIPLIYLESCNKSFNDYKHLLSCEILREDARGVLPLDTATICCYTYSIDEWREILKKRLYNETGKAHPNAVIIASMIRDELVKLGYEFK